MSNVHRKYGIEISRKNFAPQQAAQAFVMQEIKGWVDEFNKMQGIDNIFEKKFVVALAKLHNKISHSFNKNGSSEPIELDEIVIDKQ
jgi:hypothetical protein|tara:strand:- start:297 stop:557 length:261 start_codon:yes stop_codon:yes gene_type:complete